MNFKTILLIGCYAIIAQRHTSSMAEIPRYNLRRRKNNMSASGDDDFAETGSVSIEGGWYSDSSSQTSKEDLHDGETQELLNHEPEQNECEKPNTSEKMADDDDSINNSVVQEFLDAEQSSKLLSEDESNIYSDSESDNTSQSSSESKKSERLIIQPDIETAKVSDIS